MNETKFTPGPWNFEPATTNPGVDFTNSLRVYAEDPGPENDFTIAYVRDIDNPTRTAHARLIAAAPDLYAALIGAQEELRLIRMKDTNAVYDPTIRVRIELALAKAVHS